MTTRPRVRPRLPWCRILSSALICVIVATGVGQAQTAKTLSDVNRVYLGSLGDGKGAAAMRLRLLKRLRAARKIQVVAKAHDADAILSGNGRIWTTGHVFIGVHPSPANSQPVLDGFLSADLQGEGGTILWSYLVTPNKFSVKPITDNLADQLVQELLKAVEQKIPETQPPAGKEASVPVSIYGAGATFPWPLYQKWFQSFEQRAPNVHIRYDPTGSQSGIQILTKGSVDFAGSDMPLPDQAMAQSRVKFLHFAAAMGAVVAIYNLKNLSHFLNFTPSTLAGIYLGAIKKWNDPAIRATNPGISLPASEIVVVHRSDGSGTTFVWSDFLSKVSADWKAKMGASSTIAWPAGRGAEQNEGVAALVRQTPNSIGYVELTYAIQHELPYAAVRNAAGNFLRADISTVSAAASGVTAENADFRFSITNAPGKYAYPLATFTWLLLPSEGDQTQKRSAVIEFLRWALTSGQMQCSGLGYAPLPSNLANQELQVLTNLK